MGVDLGIVLALLLASVLLFILNKPRMDVVALLVILALPSVASSPWRKP